MNVTRNNKRSAHHQRVADRLDELESHPFWDPVAADHTDRYSDPETVGNSTPDYVAKNLLDGTRLIGEVEHRGDHSAHTQKQREDFQQAAQENPLTEFETVFVEEDSENNDNLPL